MAVIDLNSDNFDSTVKSSGIILIDCWADWCKACKPFMPVFERVADKFSKHTFGKLDAKAEDQLTTNLGVQHIPTLLLYRDGVLLFQQPGYFEESELEDIISQAEALDMDVVRAEIAKQSDKQGNESAPEL